MWRDVTQLQGFAVLLLKCPYEFRYHSKRKRTKNNLTSSFPIDKNGKYTKYTLALYLCFAMQRAGRNFVGFSVFSRKKST